VKVAYVGPYLSTAAGNAGLQRAWGISRSLVEAGATVIIGTGDSVSTPVMGLSGTPGVVVQHVRGPGSRLDPLRKAFDWFSFAGDVTDWLSRLGELDAVVLYGGGAYLAKRVIRWGSDADVPIVADQVEWYDPSHQPMGRFGPFARDLERGMRSTYARTGNCIVISSLLEEHFAEQGCHTVLVPPTTDVKTIAWSPHRPDREAIQFVYAGSPGLKDHMRAIIEGLERADPSGTQFHMDVYGPDPELLCSLLGRPVLPTFVQAHGRLNREAVLTAIAAADYVPLVRPDERFANAGFPTKVVESLSAGTPVICNATSDLSRHIRSGQTGWLLKEASAEAFASAATRAMVVPRRQREEMRRLARAEAEASFDYRRYTAALSDFFSNLRSGS
jgi:glycosyltransferase involved in cell wall biosynthesis